MTWTELVREYFPDVSDKEADYILWNHTGFPSFWNIPHDGDTPEACCRKQLVKLKEHLDSHGGEYPDPFADYAAPNHVVEGGAT
jgi:hypothetical protein